MNNPILSLLLVLLAFTVHTAAKRLGDIQQNEDDRELSENENKRINWGDALDKIGDGDLGDFFDDIKDSIGDFIDNVTDGFGNGWNDSSVGDRWDDFTDQWGNHTWGDGWLDNWPRITDGFADWADFDWGNFQFENFTWGDINWDDHSWGDFQTGIELNNTDVDFCAILEGAVGIGKGFGVAGDCTCSGDVSEGLSIGCDFQHSCYESSPLCTEVKLNYTTGSGVSVGACIDFEGDTFPEVCFEYSYDMTDQTPQRCSASYDGNQCECDIEGFCLSLNCSMYLPGAAIDSCQLLQTITGDDIATFLPQFPVFNDNFTQIFDEINWKALDWKNLDKRNFNVDAIEWGSNTREKAFDEVVAFDISDDLICPILQMFVDMSDDFVSDGSCECSRQSDGGFFMDCSFEHACIGGEICASVDIEFGFQKLGSVSSETCVNFEDYGHPQTCFSFDVPVAGSNDAPSCSATYGGASCQCSISNSLCLTIDCSEYEEAAVVDTCQGISLGELGASSFIPRFSRVVAADADVDAGTENQDSSTASKIVVPAVLLSFSIFLSYI